MKPAKISAGEALLEALRLEQHSEDRRYFACGTILISGPAACTP
jgi:hypothetical protein